VIMCNLPRTKHMCSNSLRPVRAEHEENETLNTTYTVMMFFFDGFLSGVLANKCDIHNYGICESHV
jgi:hypothetical protein